MMITQYICQPPVVTEEFIPELGQKYAIVILNRGIVGLEDNSFQLWSQ